MDGFAEFWNIVPRKIGKGAAEKAYAKAVKAADAATIHGAMLAYAKAREGEDQQYTVHPATWLNQRRWEDDPAGINGNGGGNGRQTGNRAETGAERAKRIAAQYRASRGMDSGPGDDAVVPLLPARQPGGRW